MSSGRRTAFAGTALALAIGAVVVVVLSVEPRPVDVRRVDLSPVEPGVLSATYTTTIVAQRSSTAVGVIAPPAPRPAPPNPDSTTSPPLPPHPPPPPPNHQTCTRTHPPGKPCRPDHGPDHPRRHCDRLREHGLPDLSAAGRHPRPPHDPCRTRP
ncbi:hypothetical protein [Saccharothrix lopnurensis]|uniref:Uncharacterized protein n=1 Tax=Saccharothrix lopnurensis TaxID=1670621 RepID=A0ABW1P1G9_9PSEU